MTENETVRTTQAYDFDDIRPYHDQEVPLKLRQLTADPLCLQLMRYLQPDTTEKQVQEKVDRVHNTMDFQLEFMNDAIHRILELSSSGYSSSGFEQLNSACKHLYVANHRDIFLDAAILQIELVRQGFPTTEISFGSNLSEEGFITTFAKLNRMFPIVREGSSKELYEFSGKLSAYIRHKITQEDTSVWIAQRNGRTKDGRDITQTGLLKMLGLSGKKEFSDNFSALSIVPVSIAYEYEPCDFLKAREIFLTGTAEGYEKSEGEDLNSIVTGLRQHKGRIHIALGSGISRESLLKMNESAGLNDKLRMLAAAIDEQIISNYQLFPNNYIAADFLNDSDSYAEHYTNEEKTAFMKYAATGIRSLGLQPAEIERIFFGIYANPVFSKEKLDSASK